MTDPLSEHVEVSAPKVTGESGKPKFLDLSDGISAELLASFRPEVQEMLKKIKFDIRVDLDSVLEQPFRPVSLLEQLAIAACDLESAAYAIALLADEAHDYLFRRLERSGQEQILRWVLKSFFPSGELPEGLWPVLELYLRPEPSAIADTATSSATPDEGVQPGP